MVFCSHSFNPSEECIFFDCNSKKWFQIIAGLEIWTKIEHRFVRPILINVTLQIMSIIQAIFSMQLVFELLNLEISIFEEKKLFVDLENDC